MRLFDGFLNGVFIALHFFARKGYVFRLRKAIKIIHCYQINSPILDDKLIFAKNGDFFGHFHSLLKRRGKVAKNSTIAHIPATDDHPSMHQGRRMRNEERSIIRYIKC